MATYFYNPCAPCCLTCGWGPYTFASSADNPFSNGFVQTDFNGTPTWSISGSRLKMANGSGSISRPSPNPDATGKAPQNHKWTTGSATIQSICWQDPSSSQSGIFIGNGRVFYADWSNNQFVYAPCDSAGRVSGKTTIVPGTPHDGVQLSLCIWRQASGAFNTAYSIDGNVTATESGVTISGLTTGTAFSAGLIGFQAAQFGTSSVTCGTQCPTQSSCQQCPSLPPCWGMNVTGAPLDLNGNFCLLAAGCTLNDSSGLWTITINSDGSATLTANNGATPYATYRTPSFNCSGQNSFTFVSSTAGSGWPTTLSAAPTNCSSPPCVAVAGCGSCSWPSAWSVTISGINDIGNCQPPPVNTSGSPNPPGWPDTPCYDGPLGCGGLNGTFTLSLGGLGWLYQGQAQICVGAVDCLGFGFLFPRLDLVCVSAAKSFESCTSGLPSQWSVPGGGLMLQLWAVNVNPAVYTFGDVGGRFENFWSCAGEPYVVPYFCPFSDIECLQPVTLAQVPYTIFGEDVSPYHLGCADFPQTVTITPA